MAPIATYVFFDIQTTGLPQAEKLPTKITELTFLAVKRKHLLSCETNEVPRVQQKLTLCLNPERDYKAKMSQLSKQLSYELLKDEPVFTQPEVGQMIDNYLSLLQKPVCLIAYNGFTFDFPILMTHIDHLKNSVLEDCFYLDNYLRGGLYEEREAREIESNRPPGWYTLRSVYERVLQRKVLESQLYHAEYHCQMMLELSTAKKEKFVEYVDKNWLIILTGLLWGCTNPFIRQGTKGLRDVRASTWLGQAAAEVAFLLGNWRYVVPWLVNQAGSLSYLLAVRRAPLSLCVPAANALAFACTALTGAAFGKEDPLDTGSILGITCIVIGTALCCWDKAE